MTDLGFRGLGFRASIGGLWLQMRVFGLGLRGLRVQGSGLQGLKGLGFGV